MKKSKIETTGARYSSFEKIVKKVENWTTHVDPHVVDCVPSEVRARIVQRFIELTNESYCEQSFLPSEQQKVVSRTKKLFIEGFEICLKSGEVSISYTQWIKQLFLFFATWMQQLLFLVISIFRISPSKSVPSTFLFDSIPGCDVDDVRFVAFARRGHIKPLYDASNVIIKMQNAPSFPSDLSFNYTPDPLNYFVTNFLTRTSKIAILFVHFLAPIYYFKAIKSSSIAVLLGRDIASIPMIKSLDNRRLIEAVVKTTSAFSVQYLWEKGLKNSNFKLHMIWYSQNFIPKMYQDDEKRPDLPAARHMRVDVHWVWTEGFKSYLQYLGQESEINTIGPILWYLPEKITSDSSDVLKVAVFDVTPIPDDETAFGAVKNYYSVDTMKQFVMDILTVSSEISTETGKNVLVLLKHKRRPKVGRHDSTYLEFIQDIETNNLNFELIDEQTNLFGFLGDCNISISVPYTSTTYISAALEKPGIYYDPFAELIPQYERDAFVYFASGTKELRQLMRSCLKLDKNS